MASCECDCDCADSAEGFTVLDCAQRLFCCCRWATLMTDLGHLDWQQWSCWR